MKINQLLKNGIRSLRNRENALLDCEVLLAYVLGIEREALISGADEEADASFVKLFEQYISRIADGEPVAYIIEEKEFYGFNFFVDNRVLVPRPETEQLVDIVLDYLKGISQTDRGFKILDVGTGSGNIAVSIVKTFEELISRSLVEGRIALCLALDMDENALEVARINVLQHGVEDKVYVYQSDLLDIIDEGENYDVIAANLPYIGKERNKFISVDVEKYEPHDALFGGRDGLELYKKMFQQIFKKKIDFNLMLGEFGFAQRKAMEDLLSKYFDQRWSIEKDLAGIDRIFVVKNSFSA